MGYIIPAPHSQRETVAGGTTVVRVLGGGLIEVPTVAYDEDPTGALNRANILAAIASAAQNKNGLVRLLPPKAGAKAALAGDAVNGAVVLEVVSGTRRQAAVHIEGPGSGALYFVPPAGAADNSILGAFTIASPGCTIEGLGVQGRAFRDHYRTHADQWHLFDCTSNYAGRHAWTNRDSPNWTGIGTIEHCDFRISWDDTCYLKKTTADAPTTIRFIDSTIKWAGTSDVDSGVPTRSGASGRAVYSEGNTVQFSHCIIEGSPVGWHIGESGHASSATMTYFEGNDIDVEAAVAPRGVGFLGCQFTHAAGATGPIFKLLNGGDFFVAACHISNAAVGQDDFLLAGNTRVRTIAIPAHNGDGILRDLRVTAWEGSFIEDAEPGHYRGHFAATGEGTGVAIKARTSKTNNTSGFATGFGFASFSAGGTERLIASILSYLIANNGQMGDLRFAVKKSDAAGLQTIARICAAYSAAFAAGLALTDPDAQVIFAPQALLDLHGALGLRLRAGTPLRHGGTTQTDGRAVLEAEGGTYCAAVGAIKTAAATLSKAEEHVGADASAGAVPLTLPPADLLGKTYVVRKTDGTTNAVTISRAGSDVLEHAAGQLTSVSLTRKGQTVLLRCRALGTWVVSTLDGGAPVPTFNGSAPVDGFANRVLVPVSSRVRRISGRVHVGGSATLSGNVSLYVETSPGSGSYTQVVLASAAAAETVKTWFSVAVPGGCNYYLFKSANAGTTQNVDSWHEMDE